VLKKISNHPVAFFKSLFSSLKTLTSLPQVKRSGVPFRGLRLQRIVPRSAAFSAPTGVFLGIFTVSAAYAQVLSATPNRSNQVVLEVIRTMPQGGGYSASNAATAHLAAAVRSVGGTLTLNPAAAIPSYCSGATYLVFVSALQRLNNGSLAPAVAADLAVKNQPDGVGVWGRWNANGPGTACLFHELQIGQNFSDWRLAQPGDFMKIFWNTNVGRREHGHSAIYLGTTRQGGIEFVRFWSSNQPRGFGEKTVPKTRIAYVIFSRLISPENLAAKLAMLPTRNSYLAGLLIRDSSLAEANRYSGVE
jgi:hypothetical protein